MKAYFLEQSYKDVPINIQGIDTPAFLEATEGLVKLFGRLDILSTFDEIDAFQSDLLGSAAFKVVQSDLTGNIEVRSRTCCLHVYAQSNSTGNRKYALGSWKHLPNLKRSKS